MDILLKAALKEAQIRTRIPPAQGVCPPLEAYVSTPALVASFPEDLAQVRQLLGQPGFPYEDLPAFLRVFHLPVQPAMTLDGLGWSAHGRSGALAMVAALQKAGYDRIPLLCHLQNKAEVWQDMGVWPQMVEVWKGLADLGVVFYVENSQIMTQSPDMTRVFATWDLAPLDYTRLLEAEGISVVPVYDLCHMMNSSRLLKALGFWEGSIEDFVFDRLDRYMAHGLGHIHLAVGRSVRQGPDYHATTFESPEEKALLARFMAKLDQAGYEGQVVLETNERDPMNPKNMLSLWDDIQALSDGATAP